MNEISRGAAVARIGASIPRLEDERLLTGQGVFIDDINVPGQAHVWFVRSPYAHARLNGIDTTEAMAAEGVVAVLTGADLAADGVGVLRPSLPIKGRDGKPVRMPAWPAMAQDKARFVGDTVAMVIAETADLARDAAELVDVDYDPLDAVADVPAATADGAPLIWDEVPGNVALDWEKGDRAAVEAAFAKAAHVTELRLVNNRLIVAAIEPRGAVASYERFSGRYTIHTPTQGVNVVRQEIAVHGLGVPTDKVRVLTSDVGGGFGIKNHTYVEQVLACWAAKKLDRPVKWYGERSDAFLSDHHARDHVMEAALALDADGNFLALRCKTASNMGAYVTGAAPVIPTEGGPRMLANVYKIPATLAEAVCAVTNTTPIAAFRGAGKPEFCYVVERLVDRAARELGLDPAELRARNIIDQAAMPWLTPTGMRYDSGDFEGNMREALERADKAGFAKRRAEAEKRGMLRGFGFSMYTEPDGYKDNRASLQFDETGHLTVTITGQPNGQGHETAFRQISSSLLGLPVDQITLVQGDSDRIGPGSGSGGSRTVTVAGGAIWRSSRTIIEKGSRIAARMMEAAVEDIEFDEGSFKVAGTDRAVTLTDVAKASFSNANLDDGEDLGLEASNHYSAREYSYPNGCHVCEVEIDPGTGAVTIVNYTLVSDFGVVVNPMMVEGQLHGGIAHGIGQALYENVVYDPESAQLLSGSFMDYCLPRATEMPPFSYAVNETRCQTNPLGVKGCGESGPTAALPAVINAVEDALWAKGVRQIDMPATPERIWRALQDAKGSGDIA